MDGEWRSECRAIGDGGMGGRCRWWTRGVALVRLWDSAREVRGINGRKNMDDFTA
jgi:hypothetical protein